MGLNEILHKLAMHIGEHNPIHEEIDKTVPPEKVNDSGEEETPHAQV